MGSTPPLVDGVHPGQDTMPPSRTLLCRGELCQVVPTGVEMAYVRELCRVEPIIGVYIAMQRQFVLRQAGGVHTG